MQITPRHDGPPPLVLEVPLGDPAISLVRQRLRLGDALATLDDEQWAAPSRCDGWSAQDVISHLVSTNQFWAFSFGQAFAGEPTRFLAGFDPVASPAELVAGMRQLSHAEVLDAYRTSCEALAATVNGLDEATWAMPAEAPPGHIAASAVALHALWDAWVHERDVLLPLGIDTAVEDDEVLGCLVYGVGLGPAFLATHGSGREGVLGLSATDPDLNLVVELGATAVVRPGPAPSGVPVLSGTAIELLEALSFRQPLPCDIAEEHRWMLAGLAEVFDRTD